MDKDPESVAVLFGIDAAPLSPDWTAAARTPEELREQMRRGWAALRREMENERLNPSRRVLYVSPAQFAEYVADGICDKNGSLL